jgi:UDPglucose--hexose-1-phosphate uridylyltransferase
MHDNERDYYDQHGQTLLENLIESEAAAKQRLIYVGEDAVAFVPVCARYPYEIWIAPRRPVPDFASLDSAQRSDLARALKTTLLKYDGLWQRPFPYIMAWYQAPLVAGSSKAFHLHAECYPAYRMPGRLKYLAGTEIAAGMFTNDALPEQHAEELRRVEVRF